MNKIEALQEFYMLLRYKIGSIDSCVNWALERLEQNEDEGDTNIALLAGENKPDEVRELSKTILETYQPTSSDEETLCGKYILKLYGKYKNNEIDIHQLDSLLLSLYSGLNYPSWLTMLSRNCEYATDVEAFQEPFMKEFEYIVGLWQDSKTVNEFYNKYDRAVSDSHDIKTS